MPHIHEKIDFTADVFVVFKNKVLIRKHDKYKKWLSVGGHVDLDETPDIAALREVKEEVGLTVTLVPPRKIPDFIDENPEYKELTPPWYMNIHMINENHKHIGMVYFAQAQNDNVVPEYADDISNEWHWFTMEELERNEYGISSSVLFYAKEALRNLSE